MVQTKTSARPSVAGKANPVPPARAEKTSMSVPVAAPGEALRKANRVKGGFLDDKVAEITGARAIMDTFEGKDFKTDEPKMVTRAKLEVEFAVEGIDNPVTRGYSLGSALPSEDGVTPADEGQFICGEPGKKFRGLHEQCAASTFLNAIEEKGGYSEDVLVNEGFAAALTGVRGVLNEYQPPVRKTRPGAKPEKPASPYPIFTSIEGGPEGGTSTPAEREAERMLDKKFPKVGKKAEPEPEPEPEEAVEEGETLEDRVRELVVDLTSKGAITKTKLTQAVGKAFDGDGDKMRAVSMAVKDSFLKGMAGEGLIAYDGREVGPVAEEA